MELYSLCKLISVLKTKNPLSVYYLYFELYIHLMYLLPKIFVSHKDTSGYFFENEENVLKS